MKDRISSDFKRINALVQEADMPAADKSMALGCLAKLPALCESFGLTYESRDVDEILRLERGMLARLAEPGQAAPEGQELIKRLRNCLNSLHEHLGLPELIPVKPAALAPKRKVKQAIHRK